MENVVINFEVKGEDQLLTYVDLLEKIGQVEKGTADQFRKDTAARKAGQEQIQQSTQETLTETQKLATALKDLPKVIAGGALDTQIKKLGEEVVKTEKKTLSLRLQLRQMKNELNTLDEGSERFRKLSIEAAKLEDKIGDVSQRIRNLASDTKGIDAVISGAQGITGAFAVAEGAAALFGDGQEEIQKTLLKVNAAMAILQGLQQIQAVFLEESAAKSMIAATAEKVRAYFIDQTTGALNKQRVAMAASVVGLLVLGFVALYQAMSNVNEKTKEQIKAQQDLDKATQQELFKTSEQINSLKVLQSVINDGNNSLAVKKGAYAELQKLVPTLTNLTYEQATAQGVLNTYIESEIKLIELRAKAKALETILIEENKKAFEDQRKSVENDMIATRIKIRLAALQAGADDKEIERLIQLSDASFNLTDARTELLNINKQIFALQNQEANVIAAQKPAEKKKEEAKKLTPAQQKELDFLEEARAKRKLDGEDYDRGQKEKEQTALEVAAMQIKAEDDVEARKQKAHEDELLRIAKEKAERELLQDAIFRGVTQTISSLQSINKTYYDWELNELKTQLDAKEISQVQYEAKVREAKRKQANMDKALASFNIGLSTAEAIIKFLANPGGTAGVVLSVAAGVAGAAQLAQVNAKQVPGFKRGSKSTPSGFKWVGEEGPELIHTPGGDTIIPHKKSVEFAHLFMDNNLPVMPSLYVREKSGGAADLDYKRLGKEVANAIGNVPTPFVEVYVNSDGSKQVYNSQRYG